MAIFGKKKNKKVRKGKQPVVDSVSFGKAEIAFWPARRFGRIAQHPFSLVSQFVDRKSAKVVKRRSFYAEELLDIPGVCVLAADWLLENQELDGATQDMLGMYKHLLSPFAQGKDGWTAVERIGRKHLEAKEKRQKRRNLLPMVQATRISKS